MPDDVAPSGPPEKPAARLISRALDPGPGRGGNAFRIAHISDPHISRQYYREHIKSLKIVLKTIVDQGFDHVVLTGDIVSTADPDDFYLAREIFQSASLLNASKMTVVPGNHDIFGGPHRATDVLSFPSHIRSVDYTYRQTLFLQAFAELFEGAQRPDPDAPYPFFKRVGPFLLIGLNSIPPWSLNENPLGTNGRISEAQFRSLDSMGEGEWGNGLVPVVVMHHHMNDFADDGTSTGIWKKIESRTMRLRKRRRTKRLFNRLGVQYVLHGHIHRNEIYGSQGMTFLNAAGAVCDEPDGVLKYNLLEWRNDGTKTGIVKLGIPYQTSNLTGRLHKLGRPLSVPAVTYLF